MTVDMLERLRMDPGQRTFGELVQERQWAVGEIERLRQRLARAESGPRKVVAKSGIRTDEQDAPVGLHSLRLLRMAEVCELTGLSRGSLYQRMAMGKFPRSVRVGARAVRWRAAEVLAWQSGLGA